MAKMPDEPLGAVTPMDWEPYPGAVCYAVRSARRDAVVAHVVRYPNGDAFCLMCPDETGCRHVERVATWFARSRGRRT